MKMLDPRSSLRWLAPLLLVGVGVASLSAALIETASMGSQALQDANVTVGLFPPGGRV